jgi:hypothetical protein
MSFGVIGGAAMAISAERAMQTTASGPARIESLASRETMVP